MKIFGLAAVLSVLSTALMAQQPVGFKDLILGAPWSNGSVSKKLECKADEVNCYYFKSVSSARETIAGAEVDSIVVSRRGGTVQHVFVSFRSDDFYKVKEALLERYPDLKCEQSALQNRKGVKFDQIACAYKAANGDIVELTKRANTMDESFVIFATAGALQELHKKQTSVKKDL